MAKSPKKSIETSVTVEVAEIAFSEMEFYLLGTTPMIMHRFAQKAWQELLLPSGRRNRASLEQTLKHDPLAEFQGALYRTSVKSPAMFHIPAGAFHGAIAQAAIDMPGAKRTQIERLTKISSPTIELFGLPELYMSMVRNSDISRTPDVRSRPIFPRWACRMKVRFVKSIISQRSVVNLVNAAGALVGVGDWRSEKGGSFGSFTCVPEGDKDWLAIVKTQGRAQQEAAYRAPASYDDDTADIYQWFQAEVRRREKEGHLTRGELPDVPIHVEAGNGADVEYQGIEEV
jgi:hypothetical protein